MLPESTDIIGKNENGKYSLPGPLEKSMRQRRFMIASLVVCLLLVSDQTWGGPPRGAGKSYPLVYGATGRPYGPTQAHYQYQLRYGRPWRGGSGIYSGVNGTQFYAGSSNFNVYLPNVISPFAYPEYSPIYGLNRPLFVTPNAVYSGPVYPQLGYYGLFGDIPGVPTINHVPYQNGATGQTMIPRGFQPTPWDLANAQQQHQQVEPTPVIEQSTPQEQEKALRERVLGDESFAKMDYRQAGEHYREAMKIAPDIADARYRYAISLAARSRFEEAVDQLKLAAELDMDWPARGVTLNDLFDLTDPEDWMTRDEKNRVKTRIAEWTNRDVRDPNRLFLLSAVMMLDGDERAKGLLETAIQLNGVQRHLIAFYRPMVENNGAVEAEPTPAAVQPQVFKPASKEEGVFVPPLPEPDGNHNNFTPAGEQQPRAPQRGEVVGEERAKRVFERSKPEVPAVPEQLKVPDAKLPEFPKPNPPTGPALPPRQD